MESSKSIGERIRDLRASFDMSRDEFAQVLGVGKTTLARYETNERKPDVEFLTKLREKFEVTSDWVLFGISDKFVNADQELSVDEMLLIALCRRHSKDVIANLRMLLTSVALGESEKQG
jgi:transcriptional regulator with XRE-family HTH domain